MPPYTLLLHPAALKALECYRDQLTTRTVTPGLRLLDRLGGKIPTTLDTITLLDALMASKDPQDLCREQCQWRRLRLECHRTEPAR